MQKLTLLWWLFISLSCGVVNFSHAQTITDYLKAFEEKQHAIKKSNGENYLLLELRPSTKTNDLKAHNLIIVRKLTSNHVVIKTTSGSEQPEFIVKSWPINNQWKLNDQLLFAEKWKGEVVIKVNNLGQLNTEWKHLDGPYYRTTVKNKSDLKQLAENPNISYIGQESFQPFTESRVLDLNLNPNKINFLHYQYPQLNGEGLVVSVKEFNYDIDDIDLAQRNLPSNLAADVQDNHATEMATIIAGAGNSYFTGRGVAKTATITSSSFESVLPDSDNDYQSLNAMIQNHSYGTTIENYYGVNAEAYDLSANNNPQLLHIFSSGNQGAVTSSEGPYVGINGYANLTGNFKMSKNTLVVGSVDTLNNVPFFVSVGPTFDGRVKPEIVAYSGVGSSNSAALVSGLSLLLQEQYKLQHGALPNSALVKAILINEADDVGAPNVDFKTGFGNVNGHRSIKTIMSNQYYSNTVVQGETATFNIDVPSNTANLKITLVWNDPVATVNTSQALVNDLDLSVTAPSQTYLPWVLDASPNANALASLATRGVDRRNNVEQVTIANPEQGNYQVNIHGFDLATNSQSFSVAYSVELKDEFIWTFPTGTDNMPYNGETNGYFRWESSLSQSTGQLELSLDNGLSWEVLATNINLNKGMIRWNVPSNLSGIAKARMVVGGQTYETDDFVISRTLNFKVAFNCSDSTLFSWQRDQLAASYDLYHFSGAPYLEKVGTLTDTAIVIKTNQFEGSNFAIVPQYNNGLQAAGTPTFDYTRLNNNCYLNVFAATAENNGIRLQLNLDLTYGVNQVVFDKLVNNQFININTTNIENQSQLVVLDENPVNGLNFYRATVLFDNGEATVSETVGVFYVASGNALVFPNPVSREDFLNIYTEQFDNQTLQLEIMNDKGQLVFEKTLFSDRNAVVLPDLSAGLYIYRLKTPGKTLSGRLILTKD